MKRGQFIKSLSAFAFSTPLIWSIACNKDKGEPSDILPEDGCLSTPAETAGPFPTKTPNSFIRSDIRKKDGFGTHMNAEIKIQNLQKNCIPMENAVVDIWHCDINGDYSQYGSGDNDNWFRGRQITDKDGKVNFDTIFPGWYSGRAVHIHVHIYDRTGNSLLITQIAFQDSLATSVYTHGRQFGYQGLSGYTYNNVDSIFRDGAGRQVASVTGSLETGFKLTITLNV